MVREKVINIFSIICNVTLKMFQLFSDEWPSFRSKSQEEATSEREHSENELDLKITRLQELKEKEKAYKESYSIIDEMFLCLRCLLD